MGRYLTENNVRETFPNLFSSKMFPNCDSFSFFFLDGTIPDTIKIMSSRSRLDFYLERCGTLTLEEAKYKRTVIYEKIGDKFIRHVYMEWIDEFLETKSCWVEGRPWSPVPDNEPIVHYTVSYDRDAVEDLSGNIKLFTSERAADDYIYSTNNSNVNNENDDRYDNNKS